MNALGKAEIIQTLVSDLDMSRKDAQSLLEQSIALIKESIHQEHSVKISGFGRFQVRHKNARIGRNPKTGEPAEIKPRKVVTFKAGLKLKSEVE